MMIGQRLEFAGILREGQILHVLCIVTEGKSAESLKTCARTPDGVIERLNWRPRSRAATV